jgi:hypothetical protein
VPSLIDISTPIAGDMAVWPDSLALRGLQAAPARAALRATDEQP